MSTENKNETKDAREAEQNVLRHHWVPALPAREEGLGYRLFERADFAVHPDGRLAARLTYPGHDPYPWFLQTPRGSGMGPFCTWVADKDMKRLGFIPLLPEIHVDLSPTEPVEMFRRAFRLLEEGKAEERRRTRDEDPSLDDETVENTVDEVALRVKWDTVVRSLRSESSTPGDPTVATWDLLPSPLSEAIAMMFSAGLAMGLAGRTPEQEGHTPVSGPISAPTTSTPSESPEESQAPVTGRTADAMERPLRQLSAGEPLHGTEILEDAVAALGLNWETFERVELSRSLGITITEVVPNHTEEELAEGMRAIREASWRLADTATGYARNSFEWAVEVDPR